jgi:uncharacterized protein YcbK (DUF882 family)
MGLNSILAVVVFGALLTPVEARADHRLLWIRNIHTNEEIHVQPFGSRGHVNRRAWSQLNRLFRSWPTNERRTINPRLLRTLAQLQRHFGGRRIELLSGYRVPENEKELTSYHQVGRSADLFIEGIPNRAILDWCRAQRDLGCGYYPLGEHVHVDVRSQSVVWVDVSRVREPAEYVPNPDQWLREHLQAERP